jgi:hypothetical protein
MTHRMMAVFAVALVTAPTMVQGQSTVTATATIDQFSEVTGSGDISFGDLSRTADNVIDAAGGTGAATRTVSFNHNITVSFTNVAANLSSGTLTLPITLRCAVNDGIWGTAQDCSGASFDLDVATGLTDATLGFGGIITEAAAAAAVAGSYSGSLDIVVVAR